MQYPNGIKKKPNTVKNYSNRGMNLENALNETNDFYISNDIALIYKKPIPVTITKVDYPSRNKAKITEAYYSVPSTTDYNGIYKGKYIDFEAKVTKSTTSFPLSNIHPHQIKHLISVKNHGGISFIIVYFEKLNKIYYLDTIHLESFLNGIDRKSIPTHYFDEYGILIEERINPRINYLSVIDSVYFKGE